MAIAIHILRAANSLESAARRAFKPHGISPAQFNVLNIVSEFEAGVSFSAVADELLVDRSNVTGLVKRMVADGLLAVSASPTDGRQKVLQFTPRGRRVWRKTQDIYETGLAQLVEALGPTQLPVLLQGLKQIEETADGLYR